ncbi:hypothetical protein AK830_g9137 [Neonectria ditissima]|uniref:Uncharacterized protein n=1 Tax=Neonectria ditissima TaxID=78410 RepID=A0A0P7B6B4_9HYPO|nr:hypothetical protein AK830_g9137 [Neonectria ditissima]
MMEIPMTEPPSAPLTGITKTRLVQSPTRRSTGSTELPSNSNNGVHARTPLLVGTHPTTSLLHHAKCANEVLNSTDGVSALPTPKKSSPLASGAQLADNQLPSLNRPLHSNDPPQTDGVTPATTPTAQFTEGFMRRSDQGARHRAESSNSTQSTKPLASHRPSKVTKITKPARSKPFPCTTSLGDLEKTDATTVAFTDRDKHHRDPVSPTDWSKAIFPPKTPSAAQLLQENGCLQWQIRMARHLSFHKQHGLFEIGDFLCNVNRTTGDIIKVAVRVYSPVHGYF